MGTNPSWPAPFVLRGQSAPPEGQSYVQVEVQGDKARVASCAWSVNSSGRGHALAHSSPWLDHDEAKEEALDCARYVGASEIPYSVLA